MVFGIVDNRAASALLSRMPAARPLVRGDRHGRIGVPFLLPPGLLRLQLGQRLGQIARVNLLVGRILVAQHPSMRRAGGRADEEQLLRMRRLEQLRFPCLLRVQDGRVLSKVDPCAHTSAQDCRAIQRLADPGRVVGRVKGADNPSQGRQRREGVERCDVRDLGSDGGQR